MAQLELPYIAGFFDGEGCISIHKVADYYYQLTVVISSTSKEPLELLKNQYGGSLLCRPASGNRQPCWQWKIRAVRTKKFLLDIFPWLIIKRPQAAVALEFLSLPRGSPDKAALYMVMRALNARGADAALVTALKVVRNG